MKTRFLIPLVVALVLVLSACEALLQVPENEAPEIVLPDDVIMDVARDEAFAFETYVAVDVSLQVTTIDPATIGTDGSYESRTASDVISATITDEDDNILFQGFVTADGTLEGVLGVPTATEVVFLTITGPGIQNRTVEIAHPSDLASIVREMSVATNGVDVANRGIRTPEDKDGDGIPNVYDSSPDDKTKKIQLEYPAKGTFNVAFEDLYPRIGDGDYNDFVVSYAVEVELNEFTGYVDTITGVAFARARAAGYNHEFALRLPLQGASGTQTVRTFLFDPVTGAPTGRRDLVRDEAFADDLRIVLFDQTYDAFDRADPTRVSADNGNADGPFSVGWESQFTVEFDADSRVSWQSLRPPFDPHIRVWGSRRPSPGDTGYDVHLIGQQPLPGSINPADIVDFRDAEGFPWGLMVPGYFAHPSETTSILDAYPGRRALKQKAKDEAGSGGARRAKPATETATEAATEQAKPGTRPVKDDSSFLEWVESEGERSRDWYDYPDLDLVVTLP